MPNRAIPSQLFICPYRKIIRGAGNKYEICPMFMLFARGDCSVRIFTEADFSDTGVGVYTSDSNNWMPRVYVRGYVCAIIGFGRDRVTIVIKSYEAAAGWRSAVALTTCRPVISRSNIPDITRTTCIFVD